MQGLLGAGTPNVCYWRETLMSEGVTFKAWAEQLYWWTQYQGLRQTVCGPLRPRPCCTVCGRGRYIMREHQELSATPPLGYADKFKSRGRRFPLAMFR